jgi:hypothetical protein
LRAFHTLGSQAIIVTTDWFIPAVELTHFEISGFERIAHAANVAHFRFERFVDEPLRAAKAVAAHTLYRIGVNRSPIGGKERRRRVDQLGKLSGYTQFHFGSTRRSKVFNLFIPRSNEFIFLGYFVFGLFTPRSKEWISSLILRV